MQLVYLEVDEQLNRLHRVLRCADRHAVTSLSERFDASWIYHDLSIEGSIFRAGAATRQAEIKSEPRRTLDLEDEMVYQATLEIRVNF